MSGEVVAYSWRESHTINLDPNAVGVEIEELHQTFGYVTPEVLVEAARDPESAMHAYFDWDDDIAAKKWRKQQSRYILSSIRVVRNGDPKPRVMNVSVKLVEGGRAYQKTVVAVKDKTLWDQVMEETRNKLRAVQQRLEDLIAVETRVRKTRATKVRDAVKVAEDLIDV